MPQNHSVTPSEAGTGTLWAHGVSHGQGQAAGLGDPLSSSLQSTSFVWAPSPSLPPTSPAHQDNLLLHEPSAGRLPGRDSSAV